MASSTSYPEKAPSAQHDEATTPEVLASEAKVAAEAEHHMTLWEAVKTYPKAIGWSVLLSTTLIMEGYDLALLGNLYASPVFNEKFGTYNPEKEKFAVSAAWQSGLSNGARAGEIIGLILAGWASDRYGYKMTTVGALVLMIAFVFVLFFAPNIKILVLGEVLCGMYDSFNSNCAVCQHNRYPMGRVSKCYACICLRGSTGCAPSLPHDIYQYVLGHWAVLCCCC